MEVISLTKVSDGPKGTAEGRENGRHAQTDPAVQQRARTPASSVQRRGGGNPAAGFFHRSAGCFPSQLYFGREREETASDWHRQAAKPSGGSEKKAKCL